MARIEHTTNIQDFRTPWTHYRATCSCGWKGPNHLDRMEAVRDEGSHCADRAIDELKNEVEQLKKELTK